ncbi:MAG TPA: 50S ribosomal protein L29, partial [Gammaproteobacteria bacterium]|nr:50S ribosomal protein L29 [Gammaproteobacteria bacterium]
MKASELRQKSAADLDNELIELLRAQFNLRMQRSISQTQRHDQFTKLRRDIARIKTILAE